MNSETEAALGRKLRPLPLPVLAWMARDATPALEHVAAGLCAATNVRFVNDAVLLRCDPSLDVPHCSEAVLEGRLIVDIPADLVATEDDLMAYVEDDVRGLLGNAGRKGCGVVHRVDVLSVVRHRTEPGPDGEDVVVAAVTLRVVLVGPLRYDAGHEPSPRRRPRTNRPTNRPTSMKEQTA